MNTVARYFHTLRYLRPVQFFGRARHLLPHPRADMRAAPSLRRQSGEFTPLSGAASMTGPDTFHFLNLEARCASAADWNDPGRAALWTYNLHYFDDLNAVGADSRRGWHEALMRRWVAENPPGRPVGWDPYPTSRRIVNWIKWCLRGSALSDEVRQSLAVQARWLASRLEYHLLGNHLLANAKALVFAGAFFAGEEADALLARGMRVLQQELRAQILADGGHFELSTQYHAITLEDLLDLLALLQAMALPVPRSLTSAIDAMRRWLKLLSHPDGGIAFFNDAAFGIAPESAVLEAYAAGLGRPGVDVPHAALTLLPDSGYARLEHGALTLLADCAAVGPDHLPAHAHADSLSFELSAGTQRLLVNSGTSQYGLGEERARQRGTPAHNTVTVDGQDSSEVWGGFRVARRARTHVTRSDADVPAITAEHDGYRRLRGQNIHRRRFALAQGLRIDDEITGTFSSAEARFHVHPAVHVTSQDGGVDLLLPDRSRARMRFTGAASVEVAAATWHPRFGASEPNWVIAVRFSGSRLVSSLAFE